MNAQEIIDYIANSEKRTPVKLYVNTTGPVDFGNAQVFGGNNSFIVFGDWSQLQPVLEANAAEITDYVVENDRRNSGVHYWICGRFQPALNPVPSSGKRWKLERARSS